ncbi:GNAT family N-acetyltransferase [Nesterenkonia suensis]
MASPDLPTLLSTHLRLRAVTEDDAAFVQDLYSRPEVTEFIGTTEWVETTQDQALARIHRYRAAAGRASGIWLIEALEDRRPLGFALLKPIPWSARLVDAGAQDGLPQDTEIGWHLHPDAWGHGYATQAARALLAHARRSGLTEVVAVTHRRNQASQRVAERIGMVHQGTTDRYYDTICELFTLTL